MGDKISGTGEAGDDGAAPDSSGESRSGRETRSILPSIGSVVQAGAFGAALGGMTAGVAEMARVRQGEITTEQAMENVVKSSAQSAATMAVASVAAQVVRSHPVFGFVALATAGLGAFLLLSGPNKKAAGPSADTAVGADSVAPTSVGSEPPSPAHATDPLQTVKAGTT